MTANQNERMNNLKAIQLSASLVGSIVGVIYVNRTGGGGWRYLGWWIAGGAALGLIAMAATTPAKNNILKEGSSSSSSRTPTTTTTTYEDYIAHYYDNSPVGVKLKAPMTRDEYSKRNIK